MSTKLQSLASEMKCILLKMNAEYTALLLQLGIEFVW